MAIVCRNRHGALVSNVRRIVNVGFLILEVTCAFIGVYEDCDAFHVSMGHAWHT